MCPWSSQLRWVNLRFRQANLQCGGQIAHGQAEGIVLVMIFPLRLTMVFFEDKADL